MTSREKSLLFALIAVATGCAMAIGLFLYIDSSNRTRASITAIEKELPSLRAAVSQLPHVRELAEKAAASAATEQSTRKVMDIYAIAETLTRECKSLRLEIVRSSLSKKGADAILELRVSGDISRMLRLARDAAGQEGFTLFSLRLTAQSADSVGEATMRIGHAR